MALNVASNGLATMLEGLSFPTQINSAEDGVRLIASALLQRPLAHPRSPVHLESSINLQLKYNK